MFLEYYSSLIMATIGGRNR